MTLANAIKKLKRNGATFEFIENGDHNKTIEGKYRGFSICINSQREGEGEIDTAIIFSYKFPGEPENTQPNDYTPWNYRDNLQQVLDAIDFHWEHVNPKDGWLIHVPELAKEYELATRYSEYAEHFRQQEMIPQKFEEWKANTLRHEQEDREAAKAYAALAD